jgi:hypothetical protein
MSEREIRKIQNSTRSLETDSIITKDSPEGTTNFTLSNNKQLAMVRKQKGKLWKTYLSADGNQYVDRTLITRDLKYTHKFTDYRTFNHNFTDDLPATKMYVPWQGSGEQTTMLESRSGYLSPYDMVCTKLFFRVPPITTAATDIVFKIEKIENGSTTIRDVAEYDATADWSNNSYIEIGIKDWDAEPKIVTGELAGISLQADDTNIVTSEKHFFMTSVWKTNVIS